ncbi:MAG: long-chain fatty acid--CoA ligase [Lentisphaeria bacterium]|nr:long-chain fatty acid--CoA ligase [Candidatus Neomarinimicrobiota bacterium]MCF7842588.1 long-chain fatty acid--CoA ligase [Lentisphaeria bacterium]
MNALIGQIIQNLKSTGSEPRFYEKQGDTWQGYSGETVIEQVLLVRANLTRLGYGNGDFIGIQSNNCLRWVLADYGIAASGGVSVAIYPTLPAQQIQYILQHSGTRLVFAENAEQVEKLLAISAECPALEHIVCFDDGATFDDRRVLNFTQFMAGDEDKDNPENLDQLLESLDKRDPNRPHTLLYTAGTTGVPKGVLLNNANLMSNVDGCQVANPVIAGDRYLSFLPLSHIFERTGQYYALSGGGIIYFCDNVDRVSEYLPQVNPMVMFAVPRFFEKVYAGVMAKFAAGSFIQSFIAGQALKIGRKSLRKPALKHSIRYKLADKLVFSKVRARLGDRLKYFISGGAPLSNQIAEFLEMMGIMVLQGYGLSETSPVISGNMYSNHRVGSSGPVLYNVEVAFDADQEILVKGPSVFGGYFKDPEGTSRAFDAEGWFHTGDLGALIDGHLHITGRKKNIIVTSGGKNVMPAPLEEALEIHPMIDQVVAVGNLRNFISALIVPSFENLQEWAREKALQWKNNEDLVNLSEVKIHFKELVDTAMERFARYERIKKIALLHTPFTIEEGTLTPKFSIRREQVEKRYQALIDALYQSDSNT